MERLKEGGTFFSKVGNPNASDSFSVKNPLIGQGRDTSINVQTRWETAIRYGLPRGASPSAQWNDGQNAKAMLVSSLAKNSISALKQAGKIPSRTGGDYSEIVRRRPRLAESIAYIKQNLLEYKYKIRR